MGLYGNGGGNDSLVHRSSSGAGVTAAAAVIASVGAIASDGLDGDVTITGGTTTLARDMYYNNLTVDVTGILITRGWRVFARTITNNGVIHCDGASASGATGGAAYASGSLPPNIAGVTGVVTAAAGATGLAANSCILPRGGVIGNVYKGGVGGSSVGGANAGGAAGATGVFSVGRQPRGNVATGAAMNSQAAAGIVTPGSSGGAGAGDGTNAGGGSGASGGYGYMMAGSVTNNGAIRAKGGDGGAAAGGNAGGGAPGGGGAWEITCGTYSGTVPDCSAGAVGAGAGTGTAGVAGNAGDYFINQYKAV
jgi:hypothetical protein